MAVKLMQPPARHAPDIGTQLARQSDALDRLMAAVSQGIRSQSHFDEIETRAQAIADGIVSALRGKTQCRILRR